MAQLLPRPDPNDEEALIAALSKPLKPQTPQQVLDILRNAKPVQPKMRAATPEERLVESFEDDPMSQQQAEQHFSLMNQVRPKPPPGKTAMRAATMPERINDVVGDFLGRFSSDKAQAARNATTPMPSYQPIDPTMGSAAPTKVAGALGKAVAGKVAGEVAETAASHGDDLAASARNALMREGFALDEPAAAVKLSKPPATVANLAREPRPFNQLMNELLKDPEAVAGGRRLEKSMMQQRGAPAPTPARAPAVITGSKLGGKAFGDLAGTLKASKSGEYALKPQTNARLEDLYKIGTSLPQQSNWARENEAVMTGFAGDTDKARQWQRLWGATSPGTGVPTNTKESISALLWGLENPGKVMTLEDAQSLKMLNTPSKWGNINRALQDQPLSGDKAEAMAGYMVGDPRLPLDVHLLYGAGSKHDKFQKEIPALRNLMKQVEPNMPKGDVGNTHIYKRYEGALADAIQEFDPNRKLNQIFGEMWEGIRAHKGLKHQGGPVDILRKKGLLEAGAMLDPDRLKAALSQAGWTAGAIAGLMATLDEEQKGAPTP